jgi:AhpD family alkylhydroperoxidase
MENPMTDTNPPLQHEKNQPEIFGHLGNTHALMANHGLDHALSTLIELRASQINQCAYCVTIHLDQARKAGVSQAKLDTIVVWREVDHFSPAERVVLAWTEALTYLDRDMDLSDLRRDLREHYSDEEISVITADISMINLWNRVQKSKH